MSFVFDLWSHSDMRTHATEILRRLDNGTMPCDRAWPEEKSISFVDGLTLEWLIDKNVRELVVDLRIPRSPYQRGYSGGYSG